MNGKIMMVEPVTVFLPDVQGKLTVDKVSTILRDGRQVLKTAAGNYLDNVHDHSHTASVQNVEVGLKPVMASAVNGVGALEFDHSEPATLIKDTVAHMKALVEPVIQKFEAITQVRTVGGPSDEVQEQIESRLQALLGEKDVEQARLIASEIERLISNEAGLIRGEAGMMEEESSRVEKGLYEEKGEFDRRAGQLGEGFGLYKGSIDWQRRALHSVDDAAVRKGEPLRQKCRQVVVEVSGVEEVWREFTAQLFQKTEVLVD